MAYGLHFTRSGCTLFLKAGRMTMNLQAVDTMREESMEEIVTMNTLKMLKKIATIRLTAARTALDRFRWSQIRSQYHHLSLPRLRRRSLIRISHPSFLLLSKLLKALHHPRDHLNSMPMILLVRATLLLLHLRVLGPRLVERAKMISIKTLLFTVTIYMFGGN